jgi:hypothetical protein
MSDSLDSNDFEIVMLNDMVRMSRIFQQAYSLFNLITRTYPPSQVLLSQFCSKCNC